jgi:hypothetical protein
MSADANSGRLFPESSKIHEYDKRVYLVSGILMDNKVCRYIFFKLQHVKSLRKMKKKMCRVSARRLSINNFAWELLKVTKKVYLIPQK